MGIFSDPKKIAIILLLPSIIFVGAYFLLPVDGQQIQIAAFAFYTIVLAIYAWKKLEINNLQSALEEQKGNTVISKSMDLDEAMNTIREWTEEHYSEGNAAHFQWSSTHFETTVEKDPMTGDEYMFYAFITYGELNRITLYCLEGKNGDIVSHKPVRDWDMLVNPFDHVPMVQELRRKSWNTLGGSFGDNNSPAKWDRVYKTQGKNKMQNQLDPSLMGSQQGVLNPSQMPNMQGQQMPNNQQNQGQQSQGEGSDEDDS